MQRIIVIIAAAVIISAAIYGVYKNLGSTNKAVYTDNRISAPPVALRSILDNADAYNNKKISLEGNFANVCCPNCFTYKEGIDSLEIFSNDKAWHKFKPGTPIRVSGTFNVVKKQTLSGSTEIFLNLTADKVEKR